MPWCPKCETEYKEGVTICADCKVPLVDSLEGNDPMVDFFHHCLKSQEEAEKFAGFLRYSNLREAVVLPSDDEDNPGYQVQIKRSSKEQAKKLYQAFQTGELQEKKEQSDYLQELEKEQTQDAIEDLAEPLIYEKKTDRYNNFQSSGVTFTIVGGLGLCFTILSVFGVIHLLSGLFPILVLGALSLVFLILGIQSFVRAGELKKEIPEEKNLVDEINGWLPEHLEEAQLSTYDREDDPQELIDMNKINYISARLHEQFPQADSALLDELAETYYEKNLM